MEDFEAIELIRFEPLPAKPQTWADLGCGKGLFTKALSSLLPKGSHIHAIDRDEGSLREIPPELHGIHITKTTGDFNTLQVPGMLDGILMANSLHYVDDKKEFLKACFNRLVNNGYFLLVDYDLQRSNNWIPYPIDIKGATQLFLNTGFRHFRILNKRNSIYGNHHMYAAISLK